ncbi:hypothetical protein [Sphingomonas sp. PAMC 26605]|uniref:hypothetical protein n=1 Tax=Sphingomonas sp. PAMC 26605 TaxID=1112214 RepID=UPI00026CCBCE|nr:hypothetical protein [Sphingomonas sp. PAMC 26605]
MPGFTLAFAMLAGLLADASLARPSPDAIASVGDLCTPPRDWAPPFTRLYHLRNGATLVFVATLHTKDPRSATHAQIKTAVAQYTPDTILVEAASADKSASDAYLAFLATRAERQLADGHIQENLYAVTLARERHVRYRGWDLSPNDEYVGDIAAGFDFRDAIGAHLLRAHVDPFGAPAPAALDSELAAVPAARRPERFDYAAWYRAAYGPTFDPAAVTPCGTGVASAIVKAESVRRTQLLAAQIDATAKPGTVVLVEAGANHWLALRAYLASIALPK